MKYSSENMSFEKILLKLFHSEQNERLYKSLCLFASLASPSVISEDLQLPCHLSNICVNYLSCFWLSGDLLWSFCGEETIRYLLTNGTDDVTTSDSTSRTVASWEAAAINGSGQSGTQMNWNFGRDALLTLCWSELEMKGELVWSLDLWFSETFTSVGLLSKYHGEQQYS